jgi:hypothetical protein
MKNKDLPSSWKELPEELREELEREIPLKIDIREIKDKAPGAGFSRALLDRFLNMGGIGGRALYMGPSILPYDPPFVIMSSGFNYDETSPESRALVDRFPGAGFALEQNYREIQTPTLPDRAFLPVMEYLGERAEIGVGEKRIISLYGGLVPKGDAFELSFASREEFPGRQMMILRKGMSSILLQ